MNPEQLAAFAMLTGQTQPAKKQSQYWLLLDGSGNNMGNSFLKSQAHADALNAKFAKAKIKLTYQLPSDDYNPEVVIDI